MKYVTIDFRIEKNNPKYLKLTPQNEHIFAESYKNKIKYFCAKLGNDFIETDPIIVNTECPFCGKEFESMNSVIYSADKTKRIVESYCIECHKFASVYQEQRNQDN